MWAWVLPALVALYLFRPRHRVQTVPASFLWRQVAEQLSGQRLWRRLQNHRLLWLQLLFATLVIAALARPYQVQPGNVAPQAILLLDTSASMAAGERWNQARDEARQLLTQAPAGTEFLLAAADQELRLVQPFTTDRRELLRGLESLRPRALTGRDELLPGFALSLLKSNPQAQLHWFSDHELVGLPQVPHLFQGGTINYGIESFQAGPGHLFLALRNYHAQAARLEVDIQGPNAFRVQRSCALKGNGRAVLTVPIHESSGVYEAHLSPADDLGWDNQAWAHLEPEKHARLVEHGEVSPYLEAALQAASGAPVVRSSSSEFPDAIHLWSRLPRQPGPGLHFASAPPLEWIDGSPVEDQGPILLSEAGRKLFPFRGLRSQRWGPRLRLREGRAEPILVSPNGDPLLVRHGDAWVWLFPLEQSELPLSPELPVLLSALLQRQSGETPSSILCGNRVKLPGPLPVELTGPGGTEQLEQLDWLPTVPGLYHLRGQPLVVNFHAPEECDLDRPAVKRTPVVSPSAHSAEKPLTREFTRFLTGLALLVLLWEFRWWWSRR